MERKLKELVEKAVEGDAYAIEALIREKQKDIYYITMHYSDTQDVEDNAQEAMIRIYKDLHKLRDAEYFNTWMYKIIKNACNDHNRSVKNRNRIAVFQSLDEDSPEVLSAIIEERQEFLPYEYVENKEKREYVLNAIHLLPEHYQECLFMFYFQSMSYKEIAKETGNNEKQVANNLSRAKGILKKFLEKNQGKNFVITILPVGSIPLLTQIYQAEATRVFGGRDLVKGISKGIIGDRHAHLVSKGKWVTAMTAVVAVSGIILWTGVHKPSLNSLNEPPILDVGDEGEDNDSDSEDVSATLQGETLFPEESPEEEPDTDGDSPAVDEPSAGISSVTRVLDAEATESDKTPNSVLPEERVYTITQKFISVEYGDRLQEDIVITTDAGADFSGVPPDTIEKRGILYDYQSYSLDNITKEQQDITRSFLLSDIGENHTVYFRYVGRYTVTFASDEDGKTEVQKVNYGKKVQKPADLIKEGCSFEGWYQDKLYRWKWDFDINTMPGKDITLYPKWVSVDYVITVKYVTETGETIRSEVKIKASFNDKVDVFVPQEMGYRLKNWKLDGVVQGNKKPIIAKLTKDVTLTLVYEKHG